MPQNLLVLLHRNRRRLLKIGYEWVNARSNPRVQGSVFGIQFVTSTDSLSKAFQERVVATARLCAVAP